MVCDFFRSRADGVKQGAVAGGAFRWNIDLVTAVVAFQIGPPAVHNQGYRAVGALKGISAITAEENRRPASSLHQQNNLTPGFKGL